MYIYVYIYIPFSNGMLPACCKVLCSRRHVHGAPGPGSSCRPIHQVDQQTPGIPKKNTAVPTQMRMFRCSYPLFEETEAYCQ